MIHEIHEFRIFAPRKDGQFTIPRGKVKASNAKEAIRKAARAKGIVSKKAARKAFTARRIVTPTPTLTRVHDENSRVVFG